MAGGEWRGTRKMRCSALSGNNNKGGATREPQDTYRKHGMLKAIAIREHVQKSTKKCAGA